MQIEKPDNAQANLKDSSQGNFNLPEKRPDHSYPSDKIKDEVYSFLKKTVDSIPKSDLSSLPPIYISTEKDFYTEEPSGHTEFLKSSNKFSDNFCENIHFLNEINKIVYTTLTSLVVLDARSLKFAYEINLPAELTPISGRYLAFNSNLTYAIFQEFRPTSSYTETYKNDLVSDSQDTTHYLVKFQLPKNKTKGRVIKDSNHYKLKINDLLRSLFNLYEDEEIEDFDFWNRRMVMQMPFYTVRGFHPRNSNKLIFQSHQFETHNRQNNKYQPYSKTWVLDLTRFQKLISEVNNPTKLKERCTFLAKFPILKPKLIQHNQFLVFLGKHKDLKISKSEGKAIQNNDNQIIKDLSLSIFDSKNKKVLMRQIYSKHYKNNINNQHLVVGFHQELTEDLVNFDVRVMARKRLTNSTDPNSTLRASYGTKICLKERNYILTGTNHKIDENERFLILDLPSRHLTSYQPRKFDRIVGVIHKNDIYEYKVVPQTKTLVDDFYFIRRTAASSSMNRSISNIYRQATFEYSNLEIQTDMSMNPYKVMTLKNRFHSVNLYVQNYGYNRVNRNNLHPNFQHLNLKNKNMQDSRFAQGVYNGQQHSIRVFYKSLEPNCPGILLLKIETKSLKNFSESKRLEVFTGFSKDMKTDMNWDFNFQQACGHSRGKSCRFKLSLKSKLSSRYLVLMSNRIVRLNNSKNRRIAFIIYDCKNSSVKEFIFDYQLEENCSKGTIEIRYMDTMIAMLKEDKLSVYNIETSKLRHLIKHKELSEKQTIKHRIFSSIDHFMGFINIPKINSRGKYYLSKFETSKLDNDTCNTILYGFNGYSPKKTSKFVRGLRIFDYESQKSYYLLDYLDGFYKQYLIDFKPNWRLQLKKDIRPRPIYIGVPHSPQLEMEYFLKDNILMVHMKLGVDHWFNPTVNSFILLDLNNFGVYLKVELTRREVIKT